MTIDQLSQKTILVTLMRDDMERYSLDFDAEAEAARSGLTRLMGRVGEVCGLDHTAGSYLIEALPAGESCLLIITVQPSRRRRRYRVKRVHTQECFIFRGVDALLDCCRAGYRMSGSLYALDGECWLMPDYPPAPRTRVLLAEFADMRVLTAVGAARVREQGSPLLSHPARRPARPRTAVG